MGGHIVWRIQSRWSCAGTAITAPEPYSIRTKFDQIGSFLCDVVGGVETSENTFLSCLATPLTHLGLFALLDEVFHIVIDGRRFNR